MQGAVKIVAQMLLVSAGSAVIALAANALRSDGLPLVMPFPPEYKCPSIVKAGQPVEVAKALEVYGRPDIVFVDARNGEKFKSGHIKGAVHIPYSFIEPISEKSLAALRKFSTVIVYCNTIGEERSRMMAGELSSAGVEGVVFLRGGLAGWAKSGGAVAGVAPQRLEDALE